MKTDKKNMRPIWFKKESQTFQVIDQRFLPHKMTIKNLKSVNDTIYAIKEMVVRGAPLIGATGAAGVYISLVQKNNQGSDNDYLTGECKRLKKARPTAANLVWGVDRVLSKILKHENYKKRVQTALDETMKIIEEEVINCQKIGEYGLTIIDKISKSKNGKPVNILTHCNAGWLACIEYGTATAPIYTAFDNNIDVHVWVDETRPLNQGSRLTAWELGKHGVCHTIITDNAGGHIMQHGMVDLVIVGTDRTTRTGDVANKIGTYLKALAAKDNNIPFYVALPSSSFDWDIRDGIADIPIEERDPEEIKYVHGLINGRLDKILVTPAQTRVANHAFDVTPARLITGFITERGICSPSENGIMSLFPEQKRE